MGFKTELDGCEKICPHRDSIPGLSTPKRVATNTTLSQTRRRITTHTRQKKWRKLKEEDEKTKLQKKQECVRTNEIVYP